MGHTYPLPGSMAPQGALCPKLARFLGGCHAYPRVLTLFLGWGRGYPGSQRGPVGLSGALWMEICAIKHVSGRSAPKGALRPQARPLPGRMHVRYAWVPFWGGGRAWGTKLPGESYSPAVGRYVSYASADPLISPQDPRGEPGSPPCPAKKPTALCFRAQKSRKDPISTVFPLRNDQPYSEPGSDLVRFGINWAVYGLAEQPRHTPCT